MNYKKILKKIKIETEYLSTTKGDEYPAITIENLKSILKKNLRKNKIWHISDTHGYHKLLNIPKDIDIAIHSGDFTNSKDIFKNKPEAISFLKWYSNLNIKYKILIAGNHDAYPYKLNKEFRKLCKSLNIIYLENEHIIINNLKIFGSPYSPQYGDWYFMKNRSKLNKVWENIDIDTDIIITHTPPKTILDLSYNIDRKLEFCGCGALMKKLLNIKPKLHLFGHIHNNKDIINYGVRNRYIWEQGNKITIKHSNGSVVTDDKFGKLTSNGNILIV